MDIFSIATQFAFGSKTLAEEFCRKLRHECHKVGYVTVNDILRIRKEPTVLGGGDYGYNKKAIQKLTAEKVDQEWTVKMPVPGKMIRDQHGYWMAETPLVDKGGG